MHYDLADQNNLANWLSYIESIHLKDIDLELSRVTQVAKNLEIRKVAKKTIVVAGTNGKGSCIAVMESMLNHSGYNVGSYTSPHILRFSERIKLNGNEVDDSALCEAFTAVENARGDIQLTYFEFATLAAFFIFSQMELDFALLEVGLGGRLDAVNIVDADVSIITSIDLDHEDWLGADRESIGREKAGIIRENKPVVYGDQNPTNSVLDIAKSNEAPLYLAGRDFHWSVDSNESSFSWFGKSGVKEVLVDLPIPGLALCNVSLGIQGLLLAGINIDYEKLKLSLKRLYLPGRFDKCIDKVTGVKVILDVAHNPAAALMLANNIKQELDENSRIKQISVVIGVMADKDIKEFAARLQPYVDNWYVSELNSTRSMSATDIEACLNMEDHIISANGRTFTECYNQACLELLNYQRTETECEGIVIVTGSFLSVAAVHGLVRH